MRHSLARFIAFSIAAFTLSGCSSVVHNAVVSNQSGKINAALAQGKAVIIARNTIFEPSLSHYEEIPMPGNLRPPVTYWQNRHTKEALVLGGQSGNEGRGSLLTNEHTFFIVDPGLYDLMGFVKKTRLMGNLYELPIADRPIQSSIGFVKFSSTTLPQLYSYTAWVPPLPSGVTTVSGNVVTHWYNPGHYATRTRESRISAAFVDMRGMVTHNSKGASNIATFGIEPGQIMLIGDFDLNYSYGRCDLPQQNLWICPLDALALQFSMVPLQADIQRMLERYGYSFEIIRKVGTTTVIPGAFFAGQKPERRGGYLRVQAESNNKR